MKVIEKITMFFKNIFKKQAKVKMIEAPQIKIEEEGNEKINNDFRQSLKVNAEEKREKQTVKTLICEGDGLGIKPKMSS